MRGAAMSEEDYGETMIDLIIETDIGRDPDDFLALCYLVGRGSVNVRLITVSPGDPDQVAVAKFLLAEVGLDVPVGVGRKGGARSSVAGVHKGLLHRYDFPRELPHDGYGPDLIEQTMQQYPACEVFACGPLNSVGSFVAEHPDAQLACATMQGGFCSYDVHGLNVAKLEKFAGKRTVGTFNLNGDVRGARAFLGANIQVRRFVGKHLCHTIVYDRQRYHQIQDTRNGAQALFAEAMSKYLARNKKGKVLHDVVAAVAHMHPEIFTWITGRLYRDRGEWGTELAEEGDLIAVDVDRDAFWVHIASFS